MEILVVYWLNTNFLMRSTPLHCRYSTAAIASYDMVYDVEFFQNLEKRFMEMLDVYRLENTCAPLCFTLDKSVLLPLPITLHKTPILTNVLHRFTWEHRMQHCF